LENTQHRQQASSIRQTKFDTLADMLPEGNPDRMEQNKQGLAFYVRIASLVQHQNLVRSGGCIALEVGHDQAQLVERMFLPFARRTEVWVDPWGIERTVFVRM
jgi:methylase of polypeptide subunit release factors